MPKTQLQSPAIAFVLSALKKNPKLGFPELAERAKQKGFRLVPVVYGRARVMAGLSPKKGQAAAKRAQAKTLGHGKAVRARGVRMDGELEALVSEFVASLSATIEEATRQRIAEALASQFGQLGSKPGRVAAARVAKTRSARKVTRPCPVPGCGKPGRGPRFRWLCDEHRGMSKKQWLALKEETTAPAKATKKKAKPGAKKASAKTKAKAAASKAKAHKAAQPKRPPKTAPRKAAGAKATTRSRNTKARKAAPAATPQRKTAAPPSGSGRKTVAPPASAKDGRKTVTPPAPPSQRKTVAPPAA